MPQRRSQNEPLLAPVDRVGAAEELLEVTDLVEIGVCRARHLPDPESIRIGLPHGVIAEVGQDVGLGLDNEHRCVEIGADRGGLAPEDARHVDPRTDLTGGQPGGRAAVDEVPVERCPVRTDGVDVGRQGHGRL